MPEVKTAIIVAIVGAFANKLASLFTNKVRSLWHRLRKRSGREVGETSKYRRESVPDIVIDEARKQGLSIDKVEFQDGFTILDLEAVCAAYYPTWPPEKIRAVLREARATAFTVKYAAPAEDEKTVNVDIIKLPNLRPWQDYFLEELLRLRVRDLNSLDILDVGIGNGFAYESLFKEVRAFTAVDISEKALGYARDKFPHMTSYRNDAEDLASIKTSSVHLYMSLRTYQSTLFDRRVALREAFRVLRTGGVAVISVPTMFLKADGEVLLGLIPPGGNSFEPKMEYAREMTSQIECLFRVLNFHDVGTCTESPFEIYVHGRR